MVFLNSAKTVMWTHGQTELPTNQPPHKLVTTHTASLILLATSYLSVTAFSLPALATQSTVKAGRDWPQLSGYQRCQPEYPEIGTVETTDKNEYL